MSNNSTIKCPNCNHTFPIANALSNEIEMEIRTKYLNKYKEDKQKMEAEKAQLAKETEQLKLQAENQDTILKEKLRLEKTKLETEAIKKAANEMKMQFEKINEELTLKSQKLKESQQVELELRLKEKNLIEREEGMQLELEKKMQVERSLIEEKIKKIETERSELKIKELEKKLADQVELAETMRRKAEQGSTQLQGEVQELFLENMLQSTYPFDLILEVGKGRRGADCVQIIRNTLAQECGKIIYESKRTQNFSNEWVDKLKTDMRAENADVAILVSEVLPKGLENFGFKEGVWICRMADVKALSFVLRDSLLKIKTVSVSQENKGEKMQMLYNFLTSNEFKQNIEAVVESYVSLRDGISKEKMTMEKIWKEREKQLEKISLNTIQFYGSIKGIAGSAVGDIKLLEG